MADIAIRIESRAGRITLTRPQALNALTYEMCLAIDAALIAWADDAAVDLVLIDAEGPRAFCSGGDIAQMHATGMAGDYSYGRQFWADEYRMNARIAEYPKPVVSFLQGFTMGGGVGVGCHGSHRIVCETSMIAMPECSIGLIPDVGGSLILARAPGRLGEYLGLTASRLQGADAIHAGFADHLVPLDAWEGLKQGLVRTGDATVISPAAQTITPPLAARQARIDRLFAGADLSAILAALAGPHADPEDQDIADAALKSMGRNSPLAMACTVALIHQLRKAKADIRGALEMEYRFTFRALERSDFLEGIRAAIIDKDRTPRWRHADPARVTAAEVAEMLAPLGPDALTFTA
jgi:enoyl-CoA hydratase